METLNPIQLSHAYTGSRHAYYANINEFTKGSITCYFDELGNLSATTLNGGGAKQEELLQKVVEHINRLGVVIPEPNQTTQRNTQ
jgi:hypothetical protein